MDRMVINAIHAIISRLAGLLLSSACALPLAAAENWPSFRGSQASGQLAEAKPPTTWDVGSGENVAWKTPVPGMGHSSPVIWGERVFVTTAIPARGEPVLRTGLYFADRR